MSAVDTRAEFYSELDDHWARIWSLNISAKQPSKKIKDKFFYFVVDRCAEVDCWRINEDIIGELFSEFVDDLGSW